MSKLFFTSLVTLAVLASFVFGLVILGFLYVGTINLGIAIVLTIAINLVLWLLGPSLSDLMNRIFYKVTFLSQQEVVAKYPEMAQLISEVSTKYKFKFPRIGIIPDKNPTAFTYGSARFNARIILTEGIFTYLNPNEVRAVVAHELGHVVNRDFIVMMVASTLVQILYEIYATLIRARGKNAGGAKLIALLAYVLYIVGIYVLYYLSRTREYLADTFATTVTDPNDLANALIKISYGILVAEGEGVTASQKRLLNSTRHLGITDVKNAKHLGVASYITNHDANALSEVMVFDKVSPWATLIELSSTHPLTGKRIDNLNDISRARGAAFIFDVDAAIDRLQVDKARLYNGFWFGVFVAVLPYICLILSALFLPYAWLPAAIAIGLIVQIPYKFPFGTPEESTILNEMRNPYASPLRGKQIALSGHVIGRGVPGYIFGSDMMYQDSSGLIFLKYNSYFGGLGNFFFAVSKLEKLLGIPSRATGWFYRGMGSMVSLRMLKTDTMTIRSHPIMWSFLGSLMLGALSLYFYYGLGLTMGLV